MFPDPKRVTLCLALFISASAMAQSNAPLTGAMNGGAQAQAQAAPVPAADMPARPVVQQVQTPMPPPQASAPEPEPRPEAVGDITRALFEAQADGRRAGGALPMLGPVSSAAWNRYLESFPIPFPSGSRSGWKPRTPINQHAFRAPGLVRDARVPGPGTPVFVSMRSREHVNPLDPLRSSLAAAAA